MGVACVRHGEVVSLQAVLILEPEIETCLCKANLVQPQPSALTDAI